MVVILYSYLYSIVLVINCYLYSTCNIYWSALTRQIPENLSQQKTVKLDHLILQFVHLVIVYFNHKMAVELQSFIYSFLERFCSSNKEYLKTSDAKASKCHLTFSSKKSIYSQAPTCSLSNFTLIAINRLFSLPLK